MFTETVTCAQREHPCVLIEVEGGALLGYNRARLLENIAILSSISEAANAVSISYQHALELVELMNGHSRVPLVETLKDGNHAGEAKLTPEGQTALESFWVLYEAFKLSICDQLDGRSQHKHTTAYAHK